MTLPGGCWADGQRCGAAAVRPLAGPDEMFMADAAAHLPPAHKTTALLARRVTRLGQCGDVTADMVRNLTVGDREALLLHLRRFTLGDQIACVLHCPSPQCGRKLDFTLRSSDLLQPPYAHTDMWHERMFGDNGTSYGVRFRLPTGGDLEVAAPLAPNDARAGADLIVQRCVGAVTRNDEPIDADQWPGMMARQLGPVMAELDPQAELRMNMACPHCRHQFWTIFDTARFFFEELALRAGRLQHEVHLLAYYYHWSEAAIMAMSAQKRGRYAQVLSDAVRREAPS